MTCHITERSFTSQRLSDMAAQSGFAIIQTEFSKGLPGYGFLPECGRNVIFLTLISQVQVLCVGPIFENSS